MSINYNSIFNLNSLKIELKEQKQATRNYLSKYSNIQGKRLSQKLNPKWKLPPLVKVSNDVSIKHELWETNKKFNNVKENISVLKNVFSGEKVYETELPYVDDSKSDSLPNIEDLKPEISEISIISIVDTILLLEDKLSKHFLELEEIKKDRFKEENKICQEIISFDKCPFEKRSSQNFLKVCKYKDKKCQSITKPRFIARTVKTLITDRYKSQNISKNTQMSQNLNMSRLTDEEKARIQELLADIDDEGEDIEASLQEEEIKGEYLNAFIFGDAEKSKMDEIQEKLMKFDDRKEERETITDNTKYEQIDWKEIKNLSIKEIDKAIDVLHAAEKLDETSKSEENT